LDFSDLTDAHRRDYPFNLSPGAKPEPQKIPSLQIQPGQQRVQVDHLATAQEQLTTRIRITPVALNQRAGNGIARLLPA